MDTLSGKDLIELGYPKDKVIGIALEVMERQFIEIVKTEKIALLQKVLVDPVSYLEDVKLKEIAEALIPKSDTINLLPQKQFQIYGAEAIEEGALKQMRTAMKLPITVAGALMPDAHPGYGLPIGGVLATKNAVIPYGVGVDIGCRMCMSLYDLPVTLLEEKKDDFKKLLLNNTRFGRDTFKRIYR
jgi:tRNA-splicing ligase RtcB